MDFKQIIGFLFYGCLFFIPFLSCILIRRKWIGFRAWLSAFILSWGVMMFAVIALWLGYDCYLSYEMSLLDTNGDGSWSDQEMKYWTESDHLTMKRYYGDGGRNVFAVFIFPIFSLAYSITVTSIYWLIARRIKNSNGDK